MGTILVAAAHPDDETLGCGGTLLRHRAEGDAVHWLIATEMTPDVGGTPERVAERNREIEAVAKHFGFAGVHRLGFPAARLDVTPRAELVAALSGVVNAVAPDTLYVPFRDDIHSDHAVLADACAAASKWFRHASVRRVRAYETLSETEFQIAPGAPAYSVRTCSSTSHRISTARSPRCVSTNRRSARSRSRAAKRPSVHWRRCAAAPPAARPRRRS